MKTIYFVFLFSVVGTFSKASPIPSGKPSPYKKAYRPGYGSTIAIFIEKFAKYSFDPIDVKTLVLASEESLWRDAGMKLPDSIKRRIESELKDYKETDREKLIGVLNFSRMELGERPIASASQDIDAAKVGIIEAMGSRLQIRSHNEMVAATSTRGSSRPYGFGIEVESHLQNGVMNFGAPCKIVSVYLGSPAHHAGIQPGDEIVSLKSGERIAKGKYPYYQDQSLLWPENSEFVDLTLKKKSVEKPVSLALQFKKFVPEVVLGYERTKNGNWNYMADKNKGIAVFRISEISDLTKDQLVSAMRQSLSEKAKSFILDLRHTAYSHRGDLVIGISELFMEKRVTLNLKSKDQTFEFPHSYKDEFSKAPLMVLTGPLTAGAAELLAVVLKDNDRAKIAGNRTAGDGKKMVEILIDTRQSVYFVWTDEYLRRDDSPIRGKGLKPDRGLELFGTANLDEKLQREWSEYSYFLPKVSTDLYPDVHRNDVGLTMAIKLSQEK